MDNKLSELSKPVAWVLGTPSCKHLTTDEEYANWYVEKMSTALPLYSQEYVSALLAELEASKQYAKERDAENESLALTVGRLRVELHNEGAANAHAYERIRELEKRLATPVRLPDESTDAALSPREYPNLGNFGLGYNAALNDCKEAIHAAGFTFTAEGDE